MKTAATTYCSSPLGSSPYCSALSLFLDHKEKGFFFFPISLYKGPLNILKTHRTKQSVYYLKTVALTQIQVSC